MSRPRQIVSFLAAVCVLLALAVGVEVYRDRVYAERASVGDQLLYVTSGDTVKKLALSFDTLLADVYWVRALQHYGYYRLHPESAERFKLLYPLLDLTTTLDPNFSVAYRFGAVFLAEPDPGGAGRPDLAVKLLEKGVTTTPNKWEYYHDIGFVYYWHLHDFRTAAEWFERGGALPGSPWWLRTYAAVMLTRGGDRRASRLMWQNMLQTGESAWIKVNAERRLSQLDALDQMDQLRRAVDEYRRRRGILPATWNDLVAARLLPGRPVDPSGAVYVLDPGNGQINLAPDSPLNPLPTEPAPGEP